MKFGIVTFPGSNCDYDAFQAVTDVLGEEATYLWHKYHDLQASDVIILPGGFSYGDYLRAGAIARFSPIMQEVAAHAKAGGPVLGICNGFQIACEAGLLPGALMRNSHLQFVSAEVRVRVENNETMFTNLYERGEVLRIPVAHGDGRFVAPADVLERLEGEGQIVFRYADADGNISADANPNGSERNIAGIINDGGNVLGMMPHPERACSPLLGSSDGVRLLESILARVAA
ncbi:MAG TPA: phosphoribosylformylglycinamidine synthase subunit PurQ [Gemmatimonadaceae bacterium]|jgi:phosphoribosylformylglycinamidine synthase|nr:phosphoribosylformylglycinamidine synthase subunit PurQ [Gemmatimonadaceae bacterium]